MPHLTTTVSDADSMPPAGAPPAASCQNCGTPPAGAYCTACGQKYPQRRLTGRELLHLLYGSVFDLDRGFLFTMRSLFSQPGVVVQHYLAGRRVIYANPVKYLLIWLGISTFVTLSVLDVEKFAQRVNQQMQAGKTAPEPAARAAKNRRAKQKMEEVQAFMFNNPQFLYAILVPLLSVCTLLFFRYKQYSYVEHMAANCYFMAQAIVIALPVYAGYVIFPDSPAEVSLFSLLLSVVGYAVCVALLFRRKSFVKSFLKGLAGYMLSFMVLSLLFGVFGFVYALAMM